MLVLKQVEQFSTPAINISPISEQLLVQFAANDDVGNVLVLDSGSN